MTQSKTKSRTLRRVKTKTPTNRVVVHYVQKSPQKPKCSKCGVALQGMGKKTPIQVSKLPKSQRRAERPFGGNLCSKCSKATLKSKARK